MQFSNLIAAKTIPCYKLKNQAYSFEEYSRPQHLLAYSSYQTNPRHPLKWEDHAAQSSVCRTHLGRWINDWYCLSLSFQRRSTFLPSTTAFLVLARKTASAISPRRGVSPMPKSRMMLNHILNVTSAGRPPSTCWHVRSTMMAIYASSTSPILRSC